jgi:hypothetical protein
MSTGAIRLKAAVWEEPLSAAVIVAVWFEAIVPTVAVKVAEVLFAGTVTDTGIVRAALLLESPTVLPPVGAAWVRVAVQVVVAPEFTLVGLQAKAETSVGAIRLRVAP